MLFGVKTKRGPQLTDFLRDPSVSVTSLEAVAVSFVMWKPT